MAKSGVRHPLGSGWERDEGGERTVPAVLLGRLAQGCGAAPAAGRHIPMETTIPDRLTHHRADRARFPGRRPRARTAAAVAAALALVTAPALAQTTPPETPGAEHTEERFGNWTLRCMSGTESAARRCEMVQVLGDTKTGQELMLIAIGYPEGQPSPIAWIILPLGVLLPPGIGLKIDQGESMGLPFRSCDGGGCATPWKLSDADVAALKRGNELMVIFKDIEGKSLGLPVSLSGFTAAFTRLK